MSRYRTKKWTRNRRRRRSQNLNRREKTGAVVRTPGGSGEYLTDSPSQRTRLNCRTIKIQRLVLKFLKHYCSITSPEFVFCDLQIVWDENKKRWVNLDEDPNDPVNELKPPPKMGPQLRAPGTLDDSNAHASFVGFSSGTFNNNVVDYNMTSGPMSLPVLGTAPARNEEPTVQRPPAPQTNMFKMQRNRSKSLFI